MSFVAKLERERTRVYDVRFTQDGRRFYCFLELRPGVEARFLRELDSGESIVLADFGEGLAMGPGEPPPELIEEMQRRFELVYVDK